MQIKKNHRKSMTDGKRSGVSKTLPSNHRRKSSQKHSLIAKTILGIDQNLARSFRAIGITTLEDLRDADLDFVLERLPKLNFATVERWQQQALLQTVFAGLGPKQAKILVNAGVTTIPAMAHVDITQLQSRIKETYLEAWKFIANRISPNVLPEQLQTTQEVEPLSLTQAVALYAQGIKTPQDLRNVNADKLDFSLLPTIREQDLLLWKYLADLRLDCGLGPSYAFQLYVRFGGDKKKIERHIQRELAKVPTKISRKLPVRTRGGSESSASENEVLSTSSLDPHCRSLAEAVTSNDKRQIQQALRGAKQWGSSPEIAGRLLKRVTDDPDLDKQTVISWITKNQLTSRRGLVDLISGFVESKDGKQDLLKTVADQFGLGALLSDIGQSPNKDSLLSLVTEVTKNWQSLILELPKLGGAATQIVEKLVGDDKIKPADMIGSVLQSDKGQKESILHTLLNSLQEKNYLDRDSTILELYNKKADFIQPFLKSLFQLGMTSCAKIDELLELPIKAFGQESAKDRDGVFTAIFKAVSAFSAENDDFDTMMSGLATWLREADRGESVPINNEGLNPGDEAGNVPLRYHLLGEGVKSFLDEANGNEQVADQFVDKLFVHLPIKSGLEEEVWLHLAKIPSLLFILLPKMLLKAITTPMRVFQWIGQDANNIIQKDRKLEILTLPPPDNEHKYAILSDVHRDAPEDLVDKYFFDLSHFSKNRDLFIAALEYYLRNGYTVIENGDCEELWVVPSVKNNKGVRARAESIISPDGPHRRVYELLAELHRQGRYFRTRGNHDDFWAQSPDNLKLLKDTWFQEGPNKFKVWDALIIPNVLTMKDNYLGILKRIRAAKRENRPIDIDELVDLFPVGLSPYRYRDRAPLFILHGHQTDFWNCDEHNFVGKILANSLGIIADGMTTFPYHLRGVDFGGRPIIEFDELLIEIPQVNNWLPEDPALRLSRTIEQSDYKDRRVQDGITYSETFTAALSLALKYPGQTGLQQVQVLVGHTHWPQSRPHLPLCMLSIPHINKEVSLRLPTQYYNSGTCGWWEGVLWGIEVTNFGQPKLFYWEKNQTAPHYMPWELHEEIPNQVLRFKDKIKKVLEKLLNSSLLEEQTENLATWEDIDDFSELKQIDLSTLDTNQQAAALNTAYLWGLRYMENRPQTSQSLEITVNLKSIVGPESFPKRYELVSKILANPHVIALTIKSFGIRETWTTLKPQDEIYYKVGSLFFYAAYSLRNSICNQLGLLLNVFISREEEFMIRYSPTKQLLSIKLGMTEAST